MRRLLLAAFAPVLTVALIAGFVSPAAAASPGRAPWVTASSPTSMTLDWPGSSSGYRTFYATSYNGVKSRGARSKKSRASKVKINGLRPGTMYCFQTARSSGADRSQRYCHSTMKVANRSRQTRLGVATFNVCGSAGRCRAWSSREDAIVRRILEAEVDVVTIQEGSRRIEALSRRLATHGLRLASASSTEAVFYRSSRLTPALVSVKRRQCTVSTIHPTVDTSGWDTSVSPHQDAGQWWYYDDQTQQWGREVETCRTVTVQVPDAGELRLGGNATAAWARLRVKRTGKAYVFVSAHLTSGKSAKNARQRGAETRRLVKKTKTVAKRSAVVFGGDFNSHRNRPNDSPRIELAKAGYHDTYDRSARYAKNYINSYNGYEVRPVRGVKYGDHVDHVFVNGRTGADRWAVVAPVRNGRNVRPIASDHNLVRVTVLLP